ncbi:MAG: EAL domain-containing protein [Rhodoferax sp.]|nr:EAL domain-containing protein [Rhodoferax sp.]
MTAQQGEDYETLIQFLYQAPIGLIQTTRAGDISMMNPMAAQLLMPLAPQGDLDNLFDIFQGVAPQLRELVDAFTADSGMVLDGLRVATGTGAHACTVSLRLLKLRESALMASVTDVSAAVGREERRLALQLGEAARIDSLTAMANRAVVLDRLTYLLSDNRAAGVRDENFAVLFLNCDRFQRINDTYGRAAGDELLRRIAARLNSVLRPQDSLDSGFARPPTAARLGSDEFAVLLEDLYSVDDARSVGQRLVDLVGEPYRVDGRQIDVSVSVGIVPGNRAIGHADDVLHNASIAMREAKLAGGGRWVLFEPAMRERAALRGSLEFELRQALDQQQLLVVYQPLVDLTDGRCTGVEALVRWQHPQRGMVSPVEFIGIAEETGLIHALGEFVLNTACRQFASWSLNLAGASPQQLAVNLSRAQLTDPDVVETVRKALSGSGLDARRLKLEVTESLAAQGDLVQQRLHDLKALGVSLALDDFGTGYSSLSSLHQLPVDVVKIDRFFVSQVETSAHHRVLIQATINVAASLGMGTVSEGIETEGQAAILMTLGCQTGQGYLYSRPLPADDATRWLIERDRQFPAAAPIKAPA